MINTQRIRNTRGLGAGSRDVGNPATLEGVAGESGRLGLPFAVKPVGHGTLTAH